MMHKSLKNILKHKNCLLYLSSLKNKKSREGVLHNCQKSVIEAICDSIFNILNGNIEIDENIKRKLYLAKATLRKLIQVSSIDTKKKIIAQRGGFLQLLIPTVIEAITLLISSSLKK